MKEIFSSNKGYRGTGVSQVTMYNGIGFISGQISCNLETGEPIRDSMAAQTERAILSLKGIMKDLGLSLDNIMKCNVFISSMDLFDEMNAVYQKYFGLETPPARQTVVAGIWGDLDVEISAEFIYK